MQSDSAQCTWMLTISKTQYALLCLAAAVGMRLFICLLKARAIQGGEADQGQRWRFWHAYWVAFRGFGGGKIEDLWLPLLIGFSELVAYPVLLKTGQLLVIGGWVGIKTAGSWGAWQTSRTSYNRFLVANILNLAISYFWLSRYVSC
jgi:hypothetical protein